ncbi:MAG TPA: SigE family RNA polymerase sigma factor [Nocardioidaceae bacterium]|nr:SigE family RNA polymerase sigma factor [Nocardioidaceae bacterium]
MATHPDVEFDEWVAARVPALMRFAYLVTGSQDAAEEAVQSALAAACEKWARVRRTQDPDAYVRRMIANAHVSQWRRFGRRVVVGEVPERQSADHAERLATNDAVWRVCATLPRQQRAAVVLRFYEDLEYAEIARILEVAEATVRSHIHRALSALREELGKEA